MSQGRPQNPIYSVDAASLQACLPKVVCSQCGTVTAIRPARASHAVRCPVCAIILHVSQEEGEWRLTEDSATPSHSSTPEN